MISHSYINLDENLSSVCDSSLYESLNHRICNLFPCLVRRNILCSIFYSDFFRQILLECICFFLLQELQMSISNLIPWSPSLI